MRLLYESSVVKVTENKFWKHQSFVASAEYMLNMVAFNATDEDNVYLVCAQKFQISMKAWLLPAKELCSLTAPCRPGHWE